MSYKNSQKVSRVGKRCSYVKNIISRMFKKNLSEEEMDTIRRLNDEDRASDPDIALSEELRKAMDDSNKVRHQLW